MHIYSGPKLTNAYYIKLVILFLWNGLYTEIKNKLLYKNGVENDEVLLIFIIFDRKRKYHFQKLREKAHLYHLPE